MVHGDNKKLDNRRPSIFLFRVHCVSNINHIIDSLLTPENRSSSDHFMVISCVKE